MTPEPDQTRDILERVDAAVLGGAPRLTRLEVADRAGVSLDLAERLWRALGFAGPGDDEQVFNDADVRALEVLTRLADLGAVDRGNVAAFARALGQAFARLAEWQSEILSSIIEPAAPGELRPQQVVELSETLLPLIEEMQSYVWRRHLATAVNRVLAGPVPEIAAGTQVVGFADIVNYTGTSRRLDQQELEDLIEHFEATTSAIVAGRHGRVVKMIGDEIMFVTDSAQDGARMALEMAAAEESGLPALRIGLAYGEVLSRLGDVYGPVVNMAARLTTVARPGTVVVDRLLSESLGGDPHFKLRRLRRVAVRGYSRLEPWLLRAATD